MRREPTTQQYGVRTAHEMRGDKPDLLRNPGSFDMGSTRADHEAKGIWFASMRRYLEEHHLLETVLPELSPDARRAMDQAIVSEWYPETALADALRVMRELICKGDAREFELLMRTSTEDGIHRFFRILLRASSYTFLLKQVPTMWARIHRGPAKVKVKVEADHVFVTYRDFPFFDDENYRLLTRAAYLKPNRRKTTWLQSQATKV